jgi:L-lactate dehydrogenase complex protein LldE
MDVQIFIPCFMDQLYPNTALNMVKVLQKLGCAVHYNTNQTCCGQPAYNAGFRNEAKEVCTKFLKDFDGADIIVTPSASCAGFIKNYYPTIFDNSSLHNQVKSLQKRVIEFSDFIVNHLKVEDVGATLPQLATYHASCASLREYIVNDAPQKLLAKVKDLQLVEMKDSATCCGFGGTFAVKFEGISTSMADQKMNNAAATGAKLIISTDISCLMHIQGYATHQHSDIQTMHLADVLASGW